MCICNDRFQCSNASRGFPRLANELGIFSGQLSTSNVPRGTQLAMFHVEHRAVQKCSTWNTRRDLTEVFHVEHYLRIRRAMVWKSDGIARCLPLWQLISPLVG